MVELKQYEATKILLSGFNQIQALTNMFDQQVNTRLFHIYSVDLDSVIVIGDDLNDLGLFKTAGYSIAMGNAMNELKVIADEITESNDQDGVAIILERLCG
jgi:hydroxymethylpyrimidine pyrophosphatase-like HAD family hydrolase